ncbi:peroxin 20, partial [Diplocarpon rosae]
MADSMCGPSNALQNFQKHSTVDRTLQQDRLIARQSPSQGFRSSPGPSADFLDQDFEAFQAGQLPLDHGFGPQAFSHTPSNLRQQPGPASWASDFERLQLSNSPQFHHQPFNAQLQQREDGCGWHQEFARQHSQNGSGVEKLNGHNSSSFRPMSGMGVLPQYMGGFNGPQAQATVIQQTLSVEAFDAAAFDRAFDEAAKAEAEAMRQEADPLQKASKGQDIELGQDILIENSAERLMADSTGLLDQERIGADRIYDPLSLDPEARERELQDDPDALSKTAAQLLDAVAHEQNPKFQNSQFLQLMRQLRSKEATIVGDKLVTTADGEAESLQVA